MPPGTVGLLCGETGNVLSDVLEADWPEGWWPDGRRFAFSTDSSWCDHAHETPTQDEIAARVAEAKQFQTVIWHRVKVKR
jgi:hypothetical protein